MITTPFTKSAPYYDLFYKDKQYAAEVEKLHSVIQTINPTSKQMIDLGCGTAEHAKYFTQLGYSVTGIDNSTQMLRIARKKFLHSILPGHFKKADITKFTSPHTFGIAVSLFHVFSYFLTNKEVQDFFSSTYKNLEEGGLLIFDCWYGPGVTSSPPIVQKRTGNSRDYTYSKIKIPIYKKSRHIVEVTHKTTIKWKTGKVSYVQETHRLRYYFYSEIKKLLTQSGFVLISWGDLNNNFSLPKTGEWDVVFVAQKPRSKTQ